MPDLYLVEPFPAAEWYPFGDSRPISELRAGAWLIRERWEGVAGGETQSVFTPPHLESFVEDGVRVGPLEDVAGPALIGNSNFAPSGEPPELPSSRAKLVNEDATVGWWVPEGSIWSGPESGEGWDPIEIDGFLLHGAYDLLTATENLLHGDVMDFTREKGDPVPDGCTVIGDPHDVVIMGAAVEPGVTFDVRAGAVVLEQHSYVKGGTRFEGPVFVGPGSVVLGGEIGHSSFGPLCKVRGEISHAVFLGYANKAHDGFLGHSIVGRWANLGAATVTSNLKNTYGAVRLELGAKTIDTELTLLGSLIGDHVKTAIGTLLQTGTVVGVGANVFGSIRPPKYIPPFAWGTDGGVMRVDGFLTVAERVLPRRKVEFTEPIREMLQAIHAHAAPA